MTDYPQDGEGLADFIVRVLIESHRLPPENPRSIMTHAQVVSDAISAHKVYQETKQ